jgi:hypothetical protein
MDVLEQFLSGGKTAAEPSKKQPLETIKIPADVQAQRDKDALAIHQAELRKAQTGLAQSTDPKQKLRYQSDIDGLTREISRNPASKAQTAPAAPVAAAPSAQAAPSGDPLEAFLSGKATTAPTPAKAAPVAGQPSTDSARQAIAQTAAQVTEPGGVRQAVGKFLKGGVETRAAVPGFLASAADVVAGAPSAIAGLVGYGAGRVFGLSPKEATAASQKIAAPLAEPIGRATGLAETQAYKQALPTQVMEYIGKNINEGAQSIAKRFGVPVQDVEAAINAGLMATGAAAPKVIGAAKKAAAELEVVKPGQLTKSQAQAQFDAKKATAGSAGAAAVEPASLKQAKANELLIPMGEDYTRAQLTRNPADVRYESDTAKHPVYGVPFQEKYAIQNDKLRRNLQAEVDNTAAKFVGLPSADFGKTVISEPFQKYKNNRYEEVTNAYTAANQAGETAQPVSYKNITDFIDAETKNRPTKKAENSLYALVEEEIKANDPNGTGKISILQMEDIRKLINDEVDPQKKGSVRLGKKLKENIDKSTENAGGDFYKKARKLNTEFAKDFDDIAVIRDINRNKKGLSDRVVPYEQLADKLVFKGPGSDLKSVLDTFEKMGPEGQQIIQELRGYTADKIMQEATKNVQLDVNNKPYVSTAALNKIVTELEKNGKLEMLFGKKGAERYSTLKDVTKELQTVPKDTTNTSGSAASIAAMLLEAGVQFGVSGIPAPLVTGVSMIKNKMDTRKQLKKADEYANPNNKISEMIK